MLICAVSGSCKTAVIRLFESRNRVPVDGERHDRGLFPPLKSPDFIGPCAGCFKPEGDTGELLAQGVNLRCFVAIHCSTNT
jgi:hypothetical protein